MCQVETACLVPLSFLPPARPCHLAPKDNRGLPCPQLSFLQGLRGPLRRAGAHFPHPASRTGVVGSDRGKGLVAFPWKTRAIAFISCPQKRCWQLVIPVSTLARPQRWEHATVVLDPLCLQTALHLAVHLDQPGAVRALVLKGASRVLQDRHGDTALHVACQRQHLACARCLLEGRPEPGRGPPHSLDLQLQNWQGMGSLRACGMRRGQEMDPTVRKRRFIACLSMHLQF